MLYKNRRQAGAALAKRLTSYRGAKNTVVLAIPRGGVPVAREVSESLNLPLGVVVTKKIGAPGQEELAIGAVGPLDTTVLDRALIERLGVGEETLIKQVAKAKKKVKSYFSKFEKPVPVKNRSAILIDDGVATGATLEVAIQYLKKVGVKKIILAIPVASKEAAEKLKKVVTSSVFLETPDNFRAVGQFYRDFPQLVDTEMIQLLQKA